MCRHIYHLLVKKIVNPSNDIHGTTVYLAKLINQGRTYMARHTCDTTHHKIFKSMQDIHGTTVIIDKWIESRKDIHVRTYIARQHITTYIVRHASLSRCRAMYVLPSCYTVVNYYCLAMYVVPWFEQFVIYYRRDMYVVPWFDQFVIYYCRAMYVVSWFRLSMSCHVCRAVNQPFHLIFFQNYVVICMSCFQSQDIHSTTYIARHGKKFWKNMARHTARHTSLHGTTYFVTRHDMGYVVPC